MLAILGSNLRIHFFVVKLLKLLQKFIHIRTLAECLYKTETFGNGENARPNKKTVLSQGNRAMPQLFFFGLKFADNIRKPGFTAPNIPAQNRI